MTTTKSIPNVTYESPMANVIGVKPILKLCGLDEGLRKRLARDIKLYLLAEVSWWDTIGEAFYKPIPADENIEGCAKVGLEMQGYYETARKLINADFDGLESISIEGLGCGHIIRLNEMVTSAKVDQRIYAEGWWEK